MMEYRNDAYYVLAGNPNTPSHVLQRLSRNARDRVRRHVAESHNVSPELLIAMATDVSADVRLAVATNPLLPFKWLRVLSQDESADVRFGIAEHLRTPRTILARLTEDENPFVSSCAQRTLAMNGIHYRYMGL